MVEYLESERVPQPEPEALVDSVREVCLQLLEYRLDSRPHDSQLHLQIRLVAPSHHQKFDLIRQLALKGTTTVAHIAEPDPAVERRSQHPGRFTVIDVAGQHHSCAGHSILRR